MMVPMTMTSSIEARVAAVEKVGLSTNGNPTWKIHTEEGRVLRTKTDSQVGYVVVPGWEGRRFRFHVDGRGHVWKAEEVGP